MRAETILQSCLLASLAVLLPCVCSVQLHGRDLNAQMKSSYDYVICGCGISGLVVANRLSEDPDVSVLCIEAGDPDNYEEFIQVPQFVGSDIGSQYDWHFATAEQIYLDGVKRLYPQGKGLGGGSILNAMCWNRGGADDYNAWESLGNPGWNWNNLLPYFKKSETYTPVYSEEIAERFSINYNADDHGFSGPVQVSYPKYFYNQSINLFSALNILGVPTQFDPNDGTNSGAAFIPTDIDPQNQTRSDTRRTYYDPYISRPNFHVITGQQCTRAVFNGLAGNTEGSTPMAGGDQNGEGSTAGAPPVGLFGDNSTSPPPSEEDNSPQSRFMPRSDPAPYRATGVEFAADGASPRQLVSALREVIFAAGSLHSAQLLQLSGVGPQDLLAKHDIPVNINLPGVGNNLQDHYLVGTFYPYNNVSDSPARLSTNETYNAEARAQYYAAKQGPWTAGSPNGVAFPSLPDTTNTTSDILAAVDSQSPSQHLVDDLDPTLVAGFSAQKDRLVELLGQRNIGAWEIINNNIGSLTVSVMHPFSRGTCHINSANPFEPPIVDPRYGSNPVDLDILAAALLFNRRILATPPMQELQPAQFVPPIDADMDAIMQVIKNGVRTEFHPSGTCAMLPRERGGVVDTSLRVYGTQNLRVVDAGIMPLIPAAHLQAPVYAVAERAADLIKADNAVDGIPSIRPPASGSSALYQATASSLSLGKSSTFGPSVPSLPAYSSSSSRIQTSKSSAPAYVAPSALISSVVPTTSLSVLSSALPVLSGTSPPAPSVSSVIASIISAIVPQLPTPAADGPTPGTASAVASSLQAALNSVVSGLMPPPSTSGAPAATSIDQTPAPSAIASSVASVVESIVSNLVPTIPEPVLPSLPPANTAPAIEPLRSTPPTSTPPPRSTEQVQALQAAIQQFVRWLRTFLSTGP